MARKDNVFDVGNIQVGVQGFSLIGYITNCLGDLLGREFGNGLIGALG